MPRNQQIPTTDGDADHIVVDATDLGITAEQAERFNAFPGSAGFHMDVATDTTRCLERLHDVIGDPDITRGQLRNIVTEALDLIYIAEGIAAFNAHCAFDVGRLIGLSWQVDTDPTPLLYRYTRRVYRAHARRLEDAVD